MMQSSSRSRAALAGVCALTLSLVLGIPAGAAETQPAPGDLATPGGEAATDGAAASGGEPEFELAQKYYARCRNVEAEDFPSIRPRLRAFTDAEVMGRMLAEPAEAARLMEVVMDPRTLLVMVSCATEPGMWSTWMQGATDFEKIARAGAPFMNPATYFKWMRAPFDPEFQALLQRMSGPAATQRWAAALANPAFYQPLAALHSPDFYLRRMAWAMNAASYAPMLGVLAVPAAPATDGF